LAGAALILRRGAEDGLPPLKGHMETKIYNVEDYKQSLLDAASLQGDREAERRIRAAWAGISEAAAAIRRGGLAAFPTETVYGLGADAFNEEAVRRIYAVKGRPSDNPMIVHVARASDAGRLTPALSPGMVRLIEAFWPGPLTLVVPKAAGLPGAVTGGLGTVALRMPDDPVALELIRRADTQVAAPSANLSGRPSPTRGAHVARELAGLVDVILSGGDCRVGIESTVLDLSGERPMILRPGAVTADQAAAVLGRPVALHPSLLRGEGGSGEGEAGGGEGGSGEAAGSPPKSPGMKYRHYAPKAEMLVLEGRRDRVESEILRLKALNEGLGRRVGTLLFEERAFVEAARSFFSELRALDDAGADLILAGALSRDDGLGFAVMNRMMKAAGYNVVRV
jgi:L-threonylcarbamoyladenylate synthase